MEELEESIDRVIAGPERKTRLISDEEKRVIAYHEAGHALVGHVLPNTDPIHKISIIPRGQALGYTLALPTEDKFLVAKSAMIDDLAMFLGGRVAEEVAVGDITTGASNDIEKATKMAKQMVMRYGMSDKLGPMTLGEPNHEVFLGRDWNANSDYSQETALEIDKEIRRLIDEAYDKAHTILADRRVQLDLMADVLIERETVDKEELAALLDDRWEEYLAQEAANEEAGDDSDSGASKVDDKETKKAKEQVRKPDAPPAAQPGLQA
jgi:cell division protease FtsH